MLAVDVLPAGEGDALVIEYGAHNAPKAILVDGGPKRFWPEVAAWLLKRRVASYEAVVVTHIDEDHIGGILAMLDDPTLRRRVDKIWFNGFLHCDERGDVLGPMHGELLTRRILLGGYRWNEGFSRESVAQNGAIAAHPGRPLPFAELAGGARIVVLAPGTTELDRLGRVWATTILAAGLVPGQGAAGRARSVGKGRINLPALPQDLSRAALMKLAGRRHVGASAANASSIAFVLEFEGKRLLMTGDAEPEPLLRGLGRYADLVGEDRPRFDLVKLPHHGSGANVTSDVIAAISATRYFVSSSGDALGHPHDAAIARLILESPGPVTLFGNYASETLLRWSARSPELQLTVRLPLRGSGIRVSVP